VHQRYVQLPEAIAAAPRSHLIRRQSHGCHDLGLLLCPLRWLLGNRFGLLTRCDCLPAWGRIVIRIQPAAQAFCRHSCPQERAVQAQSSKSGRVGRTAPLDAVVPDVDGIICGVVHDGNTWYIRHLHKARECQGRVLQCLTCHAVSADKAHRAVPLIWIWERTRGLLGTLWYTRLPSSALNGSSGPEGPCSETAGTGRAACSYSSSSKPVSSLSERRDVDTCLHAN
jgi:hypothetical protein